MRRVYEAMSVEDREKCVGDILLRFIDKEGKPVGKSHEQELMLYSIELKKLEEICTNGLVWILSERAEKADVVLAALTGGYANSLIIDSLVAAKL